MQVNGEDNARLIINPLQSHVRYIHTMLDKYCKADHNACVADGRLDGVIAPSSQELSWVYSEGWALERWARVSQSNWPQGSMKRLENRR